MRKKREIKNGFSYHITARISRQEFIFDSANIKRDVYEKPEKSKI